MKFGEVNTSKIIQIVGDGAIAHPDVGDGRLIPVLILDCDSRPDLYDMVLAHEDTQPGDVKITWGRELFNKRSVYLSVEFQRPVIAEAVIEFVVSKQGGLVELVLNARAFYFQPKNSGLRVIEGLDKPKILVEVPPGARLKDWDSIYRNFLIKLFKKQGATKKEAIAAAAAHIERLRTIGLRERS
jgi:hypothetical protein